MKSHNKVPKNKGEISKQDNEVNHNSAQETIQQNLQSENHMEIANQNQLLVHQPSLCQQIGQTSKQVKKTPYIIPELLKDINIAENSSQVNESISSTRVRNLPSCQQTQHNQNSLNNQHSYITPSQTLLPEVLNPINLINNSSSSNYNAISTHATPSLLLPPLPPNHDPQINDHQIHHFPNFDNSSTTTYFPTTPNILPNSFNFIMSGLDFSKNSLNGEPTYIDY
jgi:hypothetical protein